MLGFWLVITVEGCSLSPEWALLGDNGGAHGTTPVKPIQRDVAPSSRAVLSSIAAMYRQRDALTLELA